jgi:hypothetical protein
VAGPTVDRRLKVDMVILGVDDVYRVTHILKHAYRVVPESGGPTLDLWSWEVYRNNHGEWITDKV